jgi:glutamyl endopeptidase
MLVVDKPKRQPKSVYPDNGGDTRVQIMGTATYPSSAIAYLKVHFPTQGDWPCTGFFIGPRSVVTAGHCVVDEKTREVATSVTEITPGRSGSLTPYGTTTSKKIFYRTELLNKTIPFDKRYDYAVIQTQAPLGNTVGYFGMSAVQTLSATSAYTVRGYPFDDKPVGTMWSAFEPILYSNPNFLWYKTDTEGGQSGSPVYRTVSGVCCSLVGIHIEGGLDKKTGLPDGLLPHADANAAVRVNQAVFNQLQKWKAAP